MIEVLVSMLIMSLAILGMAGMQAATSKYRINTHAQSATSELFSEISEKIRINPTVSGNSFDKSQNSSTASKYIFNLTWEKQETIPTISKDCATAQCTSEELSSYDLITWRQKVRELLPQGSVYLEGDRLDGIRTYIMWMDKNFTEEKENIQNETKEIQKIKTSSCIITDDNENIMHNCCPQEASVPAGVKCLRMTFLP